MLLILTFITVIFWIVFSIYQAFITKKASVIPVEIIAPINATIDIQTLDQIEKRI